MQLTSSTQPISTTRWPSNGSSPVVSVSSTISRKICCLASAGAQSLHHAPVTLVQRFDQFIDLVVHVCEARAAVHNVVGARAPLGVGELPREQMLELVHRHAGPRQHALPLHMRLAR